MRYTVTMDVGERPDPIFRSNHAEMAQTTYVGGDGNFFGFDPDDGLVFTEWYSTPVVITWARFQQPTLEATWVGLASYPGVPGPPHQGITDWWTNFSTTWQTPGDPVSGGASQAILVSAPEWRDEWRHDGVTEGELQWPLKLEFDQTVEAAGFLVLHVIPSTTGHSLSSSSDDSAIQRRTRAPWTTFGFAQAAAGQGLGDYAPPSVVPKRGMLVQFVHESASGDDAFLNERGVTTVDIGDVSLLREATAGYAPGSKPPGGGNWRHRWRLHISYDHDHEDLQPEPLLPDTSYDWMALWMGLPAPPLETPHLRHKQRDDSHGRVRGVGNNPTSKQRSNRASVRNTYV